MGVLTSLISYAAKLTLVLLLVALLPGLPPYVEFEAYSITPAVPLEGQLALNSHLNGAERLFQGRLHGPEDLKVYNGQLYTTLHGGYVVRVIGDKLEHVAKFGQPCEGLVHEEAICGRPLGMHFDKDGTLYVADAYYGLFKVDIKTGQFEQLVSTNDTIEGKRPRLPNSVTVDDKGVVYWTDSSTSHNLFDGLYTVLANGNGRLLKYDPETKKTSVLVDKVHFANGVAVSGDGSFLVFCESVTSRILKYHLKGPKAGQSEVWVDGLIGMPDNIHWDPKGMFVVSLYHCRDDLDLLSKLAQFPLLRRMLARLLLVLQTVMSLIRDIYPTSLLKKYAHLIGHFELAPVLLKRVAILFLNEKGEVIRSLYATDGLHGISSFVEFEGYYYLGSPVNPFLARVKVS